MLRERDENNFSGAAEIWGDFVAKNPELSEEGFWGGDNVVSDQFRDEYVRLPYDEAPQSQECCW